MDFVMIKQFSNLNRIYKVRPIIELSQAPMFSFTDREEAGNYRHTQLLSIPMQAHYANLTVREMPYERVSLKLKDGATKYDESDLFNEVKRSLP